jgi:hypothetical protein
MNKVTLKVNVSYPLSGIVVSVVHNRTRHRKLGCVSWEVIAKEIIDVTLSKLSCVHHEP